MGFSTIFNKAINGIDTLIKNAPSYHIGAHAVAAKGIAGDIARSSWTGARSYATPMVLGAAAGGIAGAGYDTLANDRSDWRSKTKAGMVGAGMGALLAGAGKGGRDLYRGSSRTMQARGITTASMKARVGSEYSTLKNNISNSGFVNRMKADWRSRAEAGSQMGFKWGGNAGAATGSTQGNLF